MSDWNAKTIAEFRANQGKVGGIFEGAPMVLVHSRGRKIGREYVNPTQYLPNDADPDRHLRLRNQGRSTHQPGLVPQPDRRVWRQRGTRNRDTPGDSPRIDRRRTRRLYAEQARRYPGFAEYERQTAGIRIIPVLELRRA
jgi:hypothetical protein